VQQGRIETLLLLLPQGIKYRWVKTVVGMSVRLYVGYSERVVTLDSDGQSLEQVGRLTNIADRPRTTDLMRKGQLNPEFQVRLAGKESSGTGFREVAGFAAPPAKRDEALR